MAEDRIARLELLRNAWHEGDVDFLWEGVRALAQGLMELEVTDQIGVARYERTNGRIANRYGYRQRRWDTRVGQHHPANPQGDQELGLPELPGAAAAVGASAGICDSRDVPARVSTHTVEDPVQSLGLAGASKVGGFGAVPGPGCDR